MNARQTLKQFFGYDSFRGKQELVIDHINSGGHALVLMPTGMGKSVCYQVPGLMMDGLTLVISPLIALMKDQVDGLCDRGIDACYINSSLGKAEREKRYKGISGGKYKLLYVTPERFRKAAFLEVMGKREISLVAVDEAHCISDWGHDFRPDYTRVGEFIKQLGKPRVIALTATATPAVQKDIVKQLGLDDEPKLFHEGIDRPNLSLHVEDVWGEDDKLKHLLDVFKRHKNDSGSGIVYFTLIKTLERFSELLRQNDVEHLCYHGQLDKRNRKRVQDEFMGEADKLVLATNAFGMGIDKADIRFVVHADVPGSMESYYQEIGRAGRDGKDSECVLLYDQNDLMTQMEFMGWSNPDAMMYERVYHHLEEDMEQIRAFGYEWLREKLHAKKGKHDHRLVTALSMMDRHGAIANPDDSDRVEVLGPLPEVLRDDEKLGAKLRRDQEKLYALVQYVKHEGDRMGFVHDYFGLPYRR